VKLIKNSEGAVAITIALVMIILLGVTAFAIDFGIVFVTNKQLSNAADSGALAGARALGYYRCLELAVTPEDCVPVNGVIPTGSPGEAVKPKVVEAVGDNSAFDTSTLNVDPDSDIILGKWTSATQTFIPGESECNAVRVIVRKETGSDNGPVQSFFGHIFQVSQYDTSKEAIAAMTGLSIAPEGTLVPIGVSVQKCPAPQIRMQKTSESCVGWTTLNKTINVNTPNMLEAVSKPSAELRVGDWIAFGGGVNAPVFKAFHDIFEEKKDPATGLWEVMMPVFDEPADCSNPNQTLKIIGFATVNISCVDWTGSASIVRPDCDLTDSQPHDNIVVGEMKCNVVQEGPGGGGDFGTYGTIPGLVR
jgi:Flp pilus assembly protein TadG